MEAKELRIGNYVLGISNTTEIIEVIDYDAVDTDNHAGLLYNQIEPMPLTEDWLIKFGFYTDSDSWFFSLDFDGKQETFKVCPLYSNDGFNGMFSVLSCQACIKKILHVHQLQNLFFSLTGEELIVSS